MPHAIVTGANRGIGLELCRVLAERGYAVTALCRTSDAALEALPVTARAGYDVTDERSVEAFANEAEANSVDLLINNAGILQSTSLDNFDVEAMRRQFEVNALRLMLELSEGLARLWQVEVDDVA